MKALLAVVLAGCASYSPDLSGVPFTCGSSDPMCPDGYACVAGLCTNGTGSGSGSGSGSCNAFTGVLASWDMTSQPGSQTETPAATNRPGLTASALSRASTLTPTAGTGSINSSNWATGGVDPGKYYTLTITPPSGCTVALTMMSIDVLSSSTGPANASVATSADTFAHGTTISTAAPSMPALTASATSALEIRIYGFAASATTGTMRVQNMLSVTGALH